jgi:hypothetical protein
MGSLDCAWPPMTNAIACPHYESMTEDPTQKEKRAKYLRRFIMTVRAQNRDQLFAYDLLYSVSIFLIPR